MQDTLAAVMEQGLIMGVLLIVPAWRIYKKAGLSPLSSLLVLVPVLGLIAVYAILASSTWPSTKGNA